MYTTNQACLCRLSSERGIKFPSVSSHRPLKLDDPNSLPTRDKPSDHYRSRDRLVQPPPPQHPFFFFFY